MKRSISTVVMTALVTLLGACNQDDGRSTAAPTAPSFSRITGFLTSQPKQAHALTPRAEIKPIITVGDTIPGGGVWAPIPDGLGLFREGGDLVLYANHELSSSGVKDVTGVPTFQYARVSRLVLDPKTLAVKSGTYPINGSEGFQRLCSATWGDVGDGIPTGYFFTGEESVGTPTDGTQLAISRSGQVKALPWLGRFAHENYIPFPGFPGRTIMIGTDDGRAKSELYMYVGASEADILAGTGKLYVFTSPNATHSGYLTPGKAIEGRFVEVPNAASLSSSALQTAVQALGAFPFVRLEDVDYDHHGGRSERSPALYFVDTGDAGVMCGATPCDPFGSIYRMEFDRNDPTVNARLVLLERSQGWATGWASPDNIASGRNSLMLQEDPANPTFARAPRIWNFRYRGNGGLAGGEAVAELENPDCLESAGTCWESSGIIDASASLGAGAWLFDVQAHSLPVPSLHLASEGGQLLMLRVPGS